jgi:DNA-directed RNA polymerase II subunit RPB2
MDEDTWKVIDSYMTEYPDWQAQFQIDIYNDFINNRIPLAFKNKNSGTAILFDKEDPEISYKFEIYIAGKSGDKYKICPPTILDHITGKMRPMYPNEARLKNLTYGADVFYDIEMEITMKKGDKVILDKQPPPNADFLKNNYLGKIPIMMRSNLCVLNKIPSAALPDFGESEFEFGGYYILDGREKIIMSLERKAENTLFFTDVNDNKYSKTVEVKSLSDEAFENARTNKLQLEHAGAITLRLGQKNPFISDQHFFDGAKETRDTPLFIIFRLLGIESDADIIQMICGDLDSELGRSLAELLRPSAQDRYIRRLGVYTKQTAEAFLEPLVSRSQTNIQNNRLNDMTKDKLNRLSFLYDTVSENLLPHVGREHYTKACYLAYMTRRLLLYHLGLEQDTIRDSFIYKRVDTGGFLLSVLFKESIRQVLYAGIRNIKRKYEFDGQEYSGERILSLISENTYREIFDYNVFNEVFSGSLKRGTIGTKKGVVQQIDRLNYFSASSHIRRISDPAEGMVQEDQRRINVTQYGYICPCESVEGQSVGLRKAMSVMTTVSVGYPSGQLKELCYKLGCTPIRNIGKLDLWQTTRVFINGAWIGCVAQPQLLVQLFRLMRRNGLINAFTSIAWYTERDEIMIGCDGGRLVRPLYIFENNELAITPADIKDLVAGQKSFSDLCFSRLARKDGRKTRFTDYLVSSLSLLGLEFSDPELDMKLRANQAVIEYIDIQESDTCMLTLNYNPPQSSVVHTYTHAEIHPIMILGASAQISTLSDLGQSGKYLGVGSSKHPKQAVSTYATNFMHRIDTSAHLLHNPERAIIHGRLNEQIHHDKIGTGQNIIVAVVYYNGYNQEDAICGNSSSIDMGQFNSSYYKMYEDFEKVDKKTGLEERFYNPLYRTEVPEYPPDLEPKKKVFENLDKFGFIKEGTYLNSTDDVLMGKYIKTKNEFGEVDYSDASYQAKKDNLGSYVDKVFTCQTNMAGERLCKIRTCQYRKPEIGDKFASRNGQKGTFGLVIPREDMPFTDDGLVPDMLIHPSAYPKRMTINQLTEILFGTLAVELGMFGVAGTMEAFDMEKINEVLADKFGLSYYGDRVLYNGTYGEQMSASIFMGPIYYQRLKYMVADKINHRLPGIREDGVPVPGGAYTVRERQVVSGRANGGGIKIGEMERDALISHGVFSFINERDMVRGDKFVVFISAASGEISVGNPQKNLYFDPATDGPMSYHLEEGSSAGNQYIIGLNTTDRVQRDFYKVQIPYAMKLVIQELNGLGLSLKLKPQRLRMLAEAEGQSDLDDVIIGLNDIIDQENKDIRELLQKSLVEQLEEIDEETAEADADAREKSRLQAAGIDVGADGFASGEDDARDPSALDRPESFIFRARDEMPHPANVRGLGGDMTASGHTQLATGPVQGLGSVELAPVGAPPAASGTVQQPKEFEFIPRGQQDGGAEKSADKVVPPGGIPSVIHPAESSDPLDDLDLSQMGGGEEFGLEPVNIASTTKQTGGAAAASNSLGMAASGDNLSINPGSVFQSGASPAAQSGAGSRVNFTLPGDIPPPLLPLPASNQPAPFAMSGGSGADVKKITITPSTEEDLAKMGLDQLDGVASGSWALPPGF